MTTLPGNNKRAASDRVFKLMVSGITANPPSFGSDTDTAPCPNA